MDARFKTVLSIVKSVAKDGDIDPPKSCFPGHINWPGCLQGITEEKMEENRIYLLYLVMIGAKKNPASVFTAADVVAYEEFVKKEKLKREKEAKENEENKKQDESESTKSAKTSKK